MKEVNVLSVKGARKVLGKLAKNLSDKEIESDIQVATLLTNIFFGKHLQAPENSGVSLPNVP